jgi:hypothetical protein
VSYEVVTVMAIGNSGGNNEPSATTRAFRISLSGAQPARMAWTWEKSRWVVASVAGQFVGGGPAGLRGPAEEVGEQLEFGVAVVGADLVH